MSPKPMPQEGVSIYQMWHVEENIVDGRPAKHYTMKRFRPGYDWGDVVDAKRKPQDEDVLFEYFAALPEQNVTLDMPFYATRKEAMEVADEAEKLALINYYRVQELEEALKAWRKGAQEVFDKPRILDKWVNFETEHAWPKWDEASQMFVYEAERHGPYSASTYTDVTPPEPAYIETKRFESKNVFHVIADVVAWHEGGFEEGPTD